MTDDGWRRADAVERVSHLSDPGPHPWSAGVSPDDPADATVDVLRVGDDVEFTHDGRKVTGRIVAAWVSARQWQLLVKDVSGLRWNVWPGSDVRTISDERKDGAS